MLEGPNVGKQRERERERERESDSESVRAIVHAEGNRRC